MKKLLLILGIVVILFGELAWAERIKIGVSTALTGSAATYGQDIKKALLFANEVLGKGRFELIIEDDQCDGKYAVTAAQKFAHIDKVQYVLGLACSGALLASAPVYERAKIVTFGVTTSSADITNAGEYIFRTWPSDAEATKLLYDHILTKHRYLGILTEETAYAQSFKRWFLSANQGHKLRVEDEGYLPDVTDFRPTLLKLRGKGVDGLLLLPQAERALVQMVKQIREMGWNVPIYSNFFPGSPSFLDAVGTQGDEIVYADIPVLSDLATEKGKRLFREFTTKYGELSSSDINFTTAFSAFEALVEAVENSESGDVRQYLLSHTFRGPFATFSFNKHGDVVGIGYELKVIRNGKPENLIGLEGKT